LSGVKGWVSPMKRFWISLIAAGVLAVAAFAPAAAQNIFSVPLDDVDDSGVTGGASIRGVDEGVEITVFISAGDEGGVHPVHVHDGTCDDLGDVAWPLEDIEDGESVTVLDDITLGDIMTGEYAINAHQSEDEMDVNVMCGNVPAVEGLAPDEDDDAAEEDDDAATDDEDDAVTDDDDDAVADDDDDAVADDDDDAVTDDDDDAVTDDDDDAVTDDDDAVTDDEDDAVTDDEDDAVTDDEDDAVTDDTDEVTEEDDAADDAEDIVPATGGVGMNAEGAVLLMTLLSGGALGGGLLLRRRVSQA
jgi:hypothetical protein